MSAQFVAFLIFTQAINIHTFYKPINSSNSQPGRENISLQSRTTPSPSSDIGLVDALFQDCSSLFPSTSLTFPQMMIIAKDTQHQVDEARDRSNVIFDFNVTPLPQTLIATSLSTSQQRLAPSNLSLYATSSTPTPPANDLPLVFTVLILLITALAGLCASTSKISLVFTILVLFQITCSAAFIPTQIALGYWHTCALSEDNTVKCFGNNEEGQLGYGDTNPRGDQAGEMGDSLDTIDLGTNFIPTQITAGWDFTCALSQTHTVKCWGHGFYGQLGYGDRDNRGDAPGQMGDLLNTIDLGTNFIPTQIVAGQSHTCALSQSNTMKCWGTNAAGQLGYGDQEARGWGPGQMGDSLNTIDLGTNFIVTQIVAGRYHTCALSRNKTVKCWGYNKFGQLGYGDTNNRGDNRSEMGDYLNTIDLGTTFIPTQISAGWHHTCALSRANTVKCWGYNFHGGLGYGDSNNRGDEAGEMGDSLNTIDLGTNFIATQISVGGEHTCALSESNAMKCFGQNNYGQLGLGDTNNRGAAEGEMGDALKIIYLMDTATPTLTPTNHPINNPMTTETHEDSTHTRSSSLLAGVLIVLFGTITVVAIIGCFVVRCRRLKHEIQKEKLANPQTQEEYKLLNDHK
eukprot:130763_1